VSANVKTYKHADFGLDAPKIMKVFVKSGSEAEKLRNPASHRRLARPEELVPGFPPAPEHDLKFRGGRTVARLNYTPTP
jgi:hypothetical protein